jgi:hypothetical protein
LIWAKKDKQAKHIFNYDRMKNGIFNGDKIKRPGKQMRSVWSIPPPSSKEKIFGKYPTQKPLALLTRIILASTNESSLILDPFNGSGTTALAAKIIGDRKYIGIDTGKECIDLTVKRLEFMKDRLWNKLSLDIANIDRYWLTASDALDRPGSREPAGNTKPTITIIVPELKELCETGVMKLLNTATGEDYKELTVDNVEDLIASLSRNNK